MNELLPYGITTSGSGRPRLVTRLEDQGEQVVDLLLLSDLGLLAETDPDLLDRSSLNSLIGAGPSVWAALRGQLLDLVERDRLGAAVVDPGPSTLPVEVADYVDFYSSIEHATNLGRLFRPDGDPLLPNWRHLPIGYHGRSGTVVVSGTPIARPWGQWKAPDEDQPRFGPSRRLDIELELGAILAGGDGDGGPVDDPERHLFGLVLVNDWSARDIQAWEYQPLGPFLGKSFATSISPWVVPWAALEPYRIAAPDQDPQPLPHLQVDDRYNLDIGLTVAIKPAGSDRFETISETNAADLYWSFGQQIAHMTSNGAGIRDGDLIATGTISGPTRGSEGSLIEMTRGGAEPVELAAGRSLDFLADGDTIRLSGRLGTRSGRPGPPIGHCDGVIVASDRT